MRLTQQRPPPLATVTPEMPMPDFAFDEDAPRVYLGDHLKTPRLGYSHHGIYAGAGTVIARTREGVGTYSLADFTRGCGFEIVPHDDRAFTRAESLNRARSMLGCDDYDVAFRNCEHFVNWCVCGEERSNQVRRAAAVALGGLGLAATAATVLVKHPNAARKVALCTGLPLAGGAGVALRVASLAVNTAQAVSTVRSLNRIRKSEVGSFEKTAASCAVIAGLSEERAMRAARGLHCSRRELEDRASATLDEIRARIF